MRKPGNEVQMIVFRHRQAIAYSYKSSGLKTVRTNCIVEVVGTETDSHSDMEQ